MGQMEVAAVLGFEGWARLLIYGIEMNGTTSKGTNRRGEQRGCIRDTDNIIAIITIIIIIIY